MVPSAEFHRRDNRAGAVGKTQHAADAICEEKLKVMYRAVAILAPRAEVHTNYGRTFVKSNYIPFKRCTAAGPSVSSSTEQIEGD